MRNYFVLTCIVGAMVGCGSSGSDGDGTGGSAGTSASGGSGGSGASGGTSGGSGGSGGSSAASGAAGSGNAAGAGRSGGGGAGGSGGSAGSSTGGGGTGADDCGCTRGAQYPVCGVDGRSYDATCGLSCVPVEIACKHTCPCEGSGGTGGLGGGGGSGSGAGGAAAGAAGQTAGIPCGDETCGPEEYCRAPCNGTILLDAGATPGKPSCWPLPSSCMGTPSCECICGSTTPFCTPGATQVQCGCG